MASIIICVLALLLRVVYLLQIVFNDPLFFHPIMDALYHHNWAISILKGGWLAKEVFFRAPLYPYFLAILYKIFGINFLIPRIFQLLIGTLNCLIIQKIATRIFNKKVGDVAGIIATSYPLLIYFDLELLMPTILIFLILVGFYLILENVEKPASRFNWFLIGVVWGFAVITRPNVLLFLIFLPFWLRQRLKERTGLAVISGIIGVVVVIAPITIRNYAVGREFVPIAWQAGINFYIGNNPHADGITAIIPGTRKSWWGGFYDARKIAEKELGRNLKCSEIDRYWLSKGMEFIKENPLQEAALLLKKAYLYLGGLEISNNRDIYFFIQKTYLKYFIFKLPFFQFPFGILLPLSLLGVWYAYKQKKDISLLLLFLVTYSASFIAFFICSRYRLGIIPFLIILAGYSIISLMAKIREGGVRYFISFLILFVPIFLFFNGNLFKLKQSNPALDYLTLAGAEYEGENYEKAIYYLHRALHYNRDYAEALTLLGSIYKRMGKLDQAISYFKNAMNSDPKQPEPYLNLGNIYAEMGDLDMARKYYNKAIEHDPYSARAYNNLGNIYFSYGNFNRALYYYKKASKLEPNYPSPLYHMGFIYLKLGDTQKAELLWKKVLDIEPDYEDARRALKKFIR